MHHVDITNEQVRVVIESKVSEGEYQDKDLSSDDSALPMLVCLYDDNLALLKHTGNGLRKLEFLFNKVDSDDEQFFDGTRSTI